MGHLVIAGMKIFPEPNYVKVSLQVIEYNESNCLVFLLRFYNLILQVQSTNRGGGKHHFVREMSGKKQNKTNTLKITFPLEL